MANKAFLSGNLTKAPELRETPNGKSVATFSLAVKRDYSEETDFFNIVVWGKQAENCAKYLDKGSKVLVVGQLQNRSYEAKDGSKRSVTEVICDSVEFLTFKEKEEKTETVTAKRERPQLEELPDNGNLPF